MPRLTQASELSSNSPHHGQPGCDQRALEKISGQLHELEGIREISHSQGVGGFHGFPVDTPVVTLAVTLADIPAVILPVNGEEER